MSVGRTGALLERDGRHLGLYRAVVHDNADPGKRGCLELIIPEVSGPSSPHPRWAAPALGYGKASGKVWGSTLHLPEKGDVVWVQFVASEPSSLEDFPVWLPGWAVKDAVPELLLTHYPMRRGLVTPSGHALYLDDSDGSDGEVKVAHRDGAALTLPGSGDARLDSKSGQIVKLQGGGRQAAGTGHAVDCGTLTITATAGGTFVGTYVDPDGASTPVVLGGPIALKGKIGPGSSKVEIDS